MIYNSGARKRQADLARPDVRLSGIVDSGRQSRRRNSDAIDPLLKCYHFRSKLVFGVHTTFTRTQLDTPQSAGTMNVMSKRDQYSRAFRQSRMAASFLVFVGAFAGHSARCEETIVRSADGRYLVQLKNLIVALPEEDPRNQQTLFRVATPAGAKLIQFYLSDLVRDPNRYALQLRSADWSSVAVSPRRPLELAGVSVVKGVTGAFIASGAIRNCRKEDVAQDRERAIDLPTDQYGWIRLDDTKSPPRSMFIKFLDQGDRQMSRYYALECDWAGGCSIWACYPNMTYSIRINSSNKIQGEDYSVKNFDEQISSGIHVLEHMLVNQSVDLSRH